MSFGFDFGIKPLQVKPDHPSLQERHLTQASFFLPWNFSIIGRVLEFLYRIDLLIF